MAYPMQRSGGVRGIAEGDVRGGAADAFGWRGLADVIADCCAAHPLLRVRLDGVWIDPSCAFATAEWRATAAHLLPGRRGGPPPSGLVSEVVGLDQITFGPDGLITSIVSLRDRFAEEGAAARAGRSDG
ncbi:hypothetical protein MNEG_6853 [Monoraphidium neglectum]|uniref:SnoaL-like domain-containing protein n=1 Tax=Monoraphidium neglectum TaxID=145388 RepID=A0A0D2JPS4_9CHLO|nr:hypothetical protein MNEG_6853 [Monoraphidium neglectum]KIZ01108.1 hypothetical protein MNEG_6853 [Monoraphidium neglectum]|eukprot:XP_013900127.1 hypothetical protein MNEG_6853 [Monoraphidium neglectum]